MNPNQLIAEAIKRERVRSGMSLSALAARAGLAKSTLSQLEAANGNPSIETLWALATALDVPISCLFDAPQRAITLIRSAEGTMLPSDQANISAKLLSANPHAARRDIFLMSLEPGETRLSESHPSGTLEHAVLCKGRARIGPNGSEVELSPGDYLAFPADTAHTYSALEPGTVLCLIMEK